jgi:hypothetical protein
VDDEWWESLHQADCAQGWLCNLEIPAEDADSMSGERTRETSLYRVPESCCASSRVTPSSDASELTRTGIRSSIGQAAQPYRGENTRL